MNERQRRLVRCEQVVFQEVEGKQVLLNLADGQYYALDDVGSRVWALCDGTRTLSEVGRSRQPAAERVQEVARLVDRVLLYGRPVVQSGCLVRGLTRYHFLRRLGADVSLCF